jgi:hypothetical protein
VSSAILYGAIVVIWAAVLIPRWLRRGESFAAPEESSEPVASDAVGAAADASTAEMSAAEAPTAEVSGREPDRRPSERARVIGARRRLLGMLLTLALGAWLLAVTKLAAWWVILPPSVMLVGYLGLLREASKADVERRSMQRARMAAKRAVANDAGAPRPAAPVVPGGAPVVPGGAPVADAEVIDITGRVGEEFYDQHADAKLRAVGD